MYKVSMDLGRVTKYLKLKFSIAIESNQFMPLISKFNIDGNDYLKISPIPMVSLEIKSNVDRNEKWNPNRTITLTKMSKFIFCKRLDEIIEAFRKEKNLFYYQENELKLNKELSKKVREYVRIGTKVCGFQPVVVPDEETQDLFEGAVLMINSPDNYCFLTFEELEYLSNYLSNLDMDSLSLQLINTSFYCKDMESKKLQKEKKIEVQEIESTEQEKSRLPVKDNPTIPNI